MYKNIQNKFLVFVSISFFISCGHQDLKRRNSFEERTTNKGLIAEEMRKDMQNHLDKWYPMVVDSINGGFFENLNNKWELLERQPKYCVMQSRHVYTCSQSYMFYNEERYKNYAEIGFNFLNAKMWDSKYGGFYTFVSKEGNPILTDNKNIKLAYSQAFGIYGATNYFFISQDSAALNLAKRAFYWLEEHSYDKKNGGYFQFMTREGEAQENGDSDPPKDQNSSIHLLEAFTDLYKVWKDELLKERLTEMLMLIRDKIVTEQGYLQLFFYKDWTPVYFFDKKYTSRFSKFSFDHISFGHDVETAFLMIEASEALGIEHDERTHFVAKIMVDHSIQYGIDEKVGGLYDGGYYLKETPGVTIVIDRKAWWSQVEGFNTFLIMDNLYPDDRNVYFDKFTIMWDYCKNYLIDHKYGGWYRSGIDKEPDAVHSRKGGPWTGNYHIIRSMINSINSLEN